MKKITVACCGLLLILGSARSDDFKTTNGKEYKNATVTRVEADGIVVKTKGVFPKFILPSCRQTFRSGFTMILTRRLPPKPPAFDKHRSSTSLINRQKNLRSSETRPPRNSKRSRYSYKRNTTIFRR